MRTTLDIDEDILRAAEERARATGRTTRAVITEVLRHGLGVDEPELPLRGGLPQIRFDPAFEPTSDAILDLLERIEKDDDLGAPLVIPAETRAWIEQTAVEQSVAPGKLASALVEESLLEQKKWPTKDGSPEVLRRANGQRVVTNEFVRYLMDELY